MSGVDVIVHPFKIKYLTAQNNNGNEVKLVNLNKLFTEMIYKNKLSRVDFYKSFFLLQYLFYPVFIYCSKKNF